MNLKKQDCNTFVFVIFLISPKGDISQSVFKDNRWAETKPIQVSRLNYIETKTKLKLNSERKIIYEQRKIDNKINIDPKNNILSSTEIDYPNGIMKEREQAKHTLDKD